MHRLRPTGMVTPPPYRRLTRRKKAPTHWLFQEFPNAGDADGSGVRLYDYYKVGEYVKQLPTVMEKINFVSPYERPWNRFEKTWHRDFHPMLHATRKAWGVPVVPAYFDTLNFYQYITKTRIVTGENARAQFAKYYGTINILPACHQELENRFSDGLIDFLSSFDKPDNYAANNLLRIFVEDTQFALAPSCSKLNSLRVSHDPRCESFWIRSGFKKLYSRHDVNTNCIENVKGRFTGDDRRRLGELSFTMRDHIVSQLRSISPIKNIFDESNTAELERPIFSSQIDTENDVIFSPLTYNLWPDAGVLWQCPGYDADVGETHKFGCVAVKNMWDFHKYKEYWNPESITEEDEIRKDFYTSTAVVSLFNWLNGQAHCIGFTQYTDIERPLTSQLILSDGKEFWFAVAQLNTIAINIDVKGFVNNLTNVCCVDGPYKLYDEYNPDTRTFKYNSTEDGKLCDGLNPQVIQRFLEMFSNC